MLDEPLKEIKKIKMFTIQLRPGDFPVSHFRSSKGAISYIKRNVCFKIKHCVEKKINKKIHIFSENFHPFLYFVEKSDGKVPVYTPSVHDRFRFIPFVQFHDDRLRHPNDELAFHSS